MKAEDVENLVDVGQGIEQTDRRAEQEALDADDQMEGKAVKKKAVDKAREHLANSRESRHVVSDESVIILK